MATQSAAPPNPTDDKPQNPALEGVQPTIDDQHDANAEDSRGISSTSVGSPVIYRRSFLEKKGLTKEEIDEAFHRVPDPPQNVSSVQPAGTNQDGQMKPLSNVQPQVSTQTLQPSTAAPAGVVSKVGTVKQSRFRWFHAVFAVGLLALCGVLFKNAIVGKLKSWICKAVFKVKESAKQPSSKPSLEQEAAAAAKAAAAAAEAAAAAKAAAAAAADVARASQEMLISKTEEKKLFKELMNLIALQVQEMKSTSNAIQKLEGQGNNPGKIPLVEQDQVSFTNSRPSNGNGKVDYDLYSGARSSSPPATVEPSVAPHPKNYMEIMDMVQRGEKPPNISEINDLPPNPNQPLPNPHSAPRAKEAERMLMVGAWGCTQVGFKKYKRSINEEN
ncbi:hypothetical protein ACSBR2_042167 [Camellia fascicularis]